MAAQHPGDTPHRRRDRALTSTQRASPEDDNHQFSHILLGTRHEWLDKVGCLYADRWPARKHGVADADIAHAARHALLRVALDEDLTMLIGPARDGRLLEVGVLDLDGEDPAAIHAMGLHATFTRFL